MANGTMISCAEYYQDTTTYTGEAGSSTNPWAVEDCYDFCAIAQEPSGPTISGYYKFVKDIDFKDHDIYKYGISDKRIIYPTNDSTFSSWFIDGAGYSLRNLICSDYNSQLFIAFKGSQQRMTFYNINFVNFILTNCRNHSYTFGRYISFENCNFSIYLSDSYLGFLTYDCIMKNCTLNISGIASVYVTSGGHCLFLGHDGATAGQFGNYKQNCHFNFENLIIKDPITGTNQDINLLMGDNSSQTSRYVNLINCYFTGTMSILLYAGSRTIYLFKNCHTNNCYFAVDVTFKTLTGQEPPTINPTVRVAIENCTTTSFVSQLFHYADSVSGGYGYSLLSDSDCKSTSALLNIGFPVIPIANGGSD